MVDYRPVEKGDIDTLFLEIRPADLREIIAASGYDVLQTLRRSVEHSAHCLTATHEGELLCLFGVAPSSLTATSAAPWLLGTPRLANHSRALITAAREYISIMLGQYPVLSNWVDARNEASVRLLKGLGFAIEPAKPFGFAQLPFHRFEMRK